MNDEALLRHNKESDEFRFSVHLLEVYIHVVDNGNYYMRILYINYEMKVNVNNENLEFLSLVALTRCV